MTANDFYKTAKDNDWKIKMFQLISNPRKWIYTIKITDDVTVLLTKEIGSDRYSFLSKEGEDIAIKWKNKTERII